MQKLRQNKDVKSLLVGGFNSIEKYAHQII